METARAFAQSSSPPPLDNFNKENVGVLLIPDADAWKKAYKFALDNECVSILQVGGTDDVVKSCAPSAMHKYRHAVWVCFNDRDENGTLLAERAQLKKNKELGFKFQGEEVCDIGDRGYSFIPLEQAMKLTA